MPGYFPGRGCVLSASPAHRHLTLRVPCLGMLQCAGVLCHRSAFVEHLTGEPLVRPQMGGHLHTPWGGRRHPQLGQPLQCQAICVPGGVTCISLISKAAPAATRREEQRCLVGWVTENSPVRKCCFLKKCLLIVHCNSHFSYSSVQDTPLTPVMP